MTDKPEAYVLSVNPPVYTSIFVSMACSLSWLLRIKKMTSQCKCNLKFILVSKQKCLNPLTPVVPVRTIIFSIFYNLNISEKHMRYPFSCYWIHTNRIYHLVKRGSLKMLYSFQLVEKVKNEVDDIWTHWRERVSIPILRENI